ncbi:hypothetical protein OsJ_36906 [Oryza sativa Japonica Group]|uniref:Uncharacterized protein n=1 Tax=Oryza sativa subsp. japonica TaxID=39947 RepID=B9GEC2_ORYSJ|nr:hypothetical protein OsJ_36906 [Oryza sativa Japonica Group]
MSAQIAPAEQVCYVHCNFCNTILAVSVPGNSMLNIVTVRCGHCTNLLSVNLRGLMHSAPALQDHHHHHLQESGLTDASVIKVAIRSLVFLQLRRLPSSGCLLLLLPWFPTRSKTSSSSQALHARPPEKRQRVPSAYNRFIKEEIRRIKANNPDISHREAFSTAAKNWAHYPNIHFGLSPGHEGGKKLVDVDPIPTAPSSKKIQGFYS